MTRRCYAIAILSPIVLACSGVDANGGGGPDSITGAELAEHIAVLASDSFGGRAPNSPGEALTVEYLVERFRSAGLEPGNGDRFVQDVPLVDIAANPARVPFFVQGSLDNLASYGYGTEMVVWTPRVGPAANVQDSELVFVGYGIVAPEFGWNDYEGLDVTGKTVVILVNDPGYATQDPTVFSGNSMTYYGRWTYKFEEAARQGAAAALIVHQTGPAGYGWDTVRNSWTGPQFHLEAAGGNADRLAIEGWLTESTAREIFEQADVDFDALTSRAQTADFEPVGFGIRLTASVTNTVRRSNSQNVVGLLPGSEASDEYFLYVAHWDGFGTDDALVEAGEDGIYNGALDNASGIAALLELAQAFAQRPDGVRRSVVFMAVTAEERGLLGTKHYAGHPIYPLGQTVAGLNIDGLSNFGPTRELVVRGYGMSELDRIAETAAAEQGRRIDPDPEPEKGYYFRSDHFELAKLGVPMIYPAPGIDHVERGTEYGRERNAEYLANRYHMVTDEFDSSWDLSGAVADVRLYYEIGYAVVQSDDWPEWAEDSEFRAIRDAGR